MEENTGCDLISRVLLEKGEFADAVGGCLYESSAWPSPNARCWLLLLHMPWLSRCLDIAHSLLPASEVFLPTAPGERGWSPTGPLPYTSIAEHSSTISIPAKEPQPLQLHAWVHSSLPHWVPSSSLLHGVQLPSPQAQKDIIQFIGFRALNQLSSTLLMYIPPPLRKRPYKYLLTGGTDREQTTLRGSDSPLPGPPASGCPARAPAPQPPHSRSRARGFSPSREPVGGQAHGHPPAVLEKRLGGEVRETELRAQPR